MLAADDEVGFAYEGLEEGAEPILNDLEALVALVDEEATYEGL